VTQVVKLPGITLRFAWFTLTDYLRSGRLLVEFLAIAATFAIFFWRLTDADVTPAYFFSVASVFSALLLFYTATALFGLGDRPQGYVLITRHLGRTGYLLGLYLAAVLVGWGAYGALSLLVALLKPVTGLGMSGWLAGSVPLLLNLALLGALLTLLTPLVLPTFWRLLALVFIALAFSGNLIGGQTLEELWSPIRTAIDIVRTIFSTPLLPAFSGYTLAVSQDYSAGGVVTLITQLTLTCSLLMLAVYAFHRREIVFSGG
jgi:hypothetical protein